MFNKVLIANRGEIACRIIRTLRRMGIASVAIYSEADAHAQHVLDADEALCVGPAAVADSYLNSARILEAARTTGAQAIHPGYGFLSENPGFAEQCAEAGIVFIGPTAEHMRAFGLKHTARALALAHGVPLLPGSELLRDLPHAQQEAVRIGYPVMLKSTAGGGGIGMQLIRDADSLEAAYHSVARLAGANFKDSGMYLEKFVEHARHIEVQIIGDGLGTVIALGERDCSVQRRNQKVIEETPAPHLTESVRQALWQTAERLGRAVKYRSAGTVEFVYDTQQQAFYFLEVNTRLQVEHGVTELVSGLDLVEWMLLIAAGEAPDLANYRYQPQGHAIQVRLYAEDPHKQFQPSSGVLTEVQFADNTRVDTWVRAGSEVSPFYDPLVAKLMVHAADRPQAIQQLAQALDHTMLAGIETNLRYLREVVRLPWFVQGQQTTALLSGFAYHPRTMDVLEAGVQTTLQDYPGRVGYWAVGVPPSGPMDALASRLANRLVGNREDQVTLEITLVGPTLRFNCDTVIALTGAAMQAHLDDQPLPYWQAVKVKSGSVLQIGGTIDAGSRSYLAIQNGLDVPYYMGSRATFTLGQFGGHGGRPLRVGDVLHLCADTPTPPVEPPLAAALIPQYTHDWEIAVLYGPHGAPDFFTEADIEMFFATAWEVHYNSSRTGVRLIGPKPTWARSDGGEAGLHPSNIHDNAYAIGSVDFTGDMPVILGPDGPSLGGFVCPATIIQAELWKLGQLRPGDKVRFKRVTATMALALEQQQDAQLASLQPVPLSLAAAQNLATESGPVLYREDAVGELPAVVYRQAGDKNLLVEFGPQVLDFSLRLRVHALMRWLEHAAIKGILDLTPGIRSLQVHYDQRILPRDHLLAILQQAEKTLPDAKDMTVPSRIVHLPLSWDDDATRLAIEKYIQSVRKDAPWCPSNIEFIRRINGLDSIDAVKKIVFDAHYLTLGLGDVYLGAPVATPIDPRHRLVTTKYNPARTWTPENAVGIGGAYLCVYGMEGPGGYQFVGRTLQMWNRWQQTADFEAGKPWLLRFFDQIRFYPVSASELARIRADFPHGKFKLHIEETQFSLVDYQRLLETHATEVAAFKQQQQQAFEDERARWQNSDATTSTEESSMPAKDDVTLSSLDPHCRIISAHVAGNVWQRLVAEGEQVRKGQPVLMIESMKMEISVTAPADGIVQQWLTDVGHSLHAGQAVLVLKVR